MQSAPMYLIHTGYGRIRPDSRPVYLSMSVVASLYGVDQTHCYHFVRGVAYPEHAIHLWPSMDGQYVQPKSIDPR